MPSTATNDPKRFVRRRPSMSGGAPTADDATGCARGSFAEYPAGGSAREALLDLDECHHFGRCDREDGLVERPDVEVVLLAVRVDEDVAEGDLLRHALDDDLFRRPLGRDDATRLGDQVPGLARRSPRAEH